MTLKEIFFIIFLISTLSMFNVSYAKSLAGSAIGNPIDLEITSIIQHRIAINEIMADTVIHTSTVEGVVKYSGHVTTAAQKKLAIRIAQSVNNVRNVDASDLIVTGSSDPLADALITTEIKRLFLKEKLFGDRDISAISIKVETENGIVLLRGKADNQEQAQTAVELAQSVRGVKYVKSDIQVKNSEVMHE